MATNMGTLDRTLRLVAAVVLAALVWSGKLSGPLAAGAWIIAAVFVVTSLARFCPLYRVIGMDTCSRP